MTEIWGLQDNNGFWWRFTEQVDGGQGGIRTHEGREPLLVFKTSAFNRSATCPLRPGLYKWFLVMETALVRRSQRTRPGKSAHGANPAAVPN